MTRVLIIDDEEGILILWARYLAPAGFVVDTALTWREGLFKIESNPPDLVFLDLHLPDSRPAAATLEKIEVIRKYAPKAVVVVITGMLEGSEIEGLAKAAGADAFQFKNAIENGETLLAVVKKIYMAIAKKTPRERAELGLEIMDKLSRLLPVDVSQQKA